MRLPGRLQVIPGNVTWILDVAHNVQAISNLALELKDLPCTGDTHAVFACLSDKDVHGILKSLVAQVDRWHLAPLDGQRARPVASLVAALNTIGTSVSWRGYESVKEALSGAVGEARQGDRIVVTGSFRTVMVALDERPGLI